MTSPHLSSLLKEKGETSQNAHWGPSPQWTRTIIVGTGPMPLSGTGKDPHISVFYLGRASKYFR